LGKSAPIVLGIIDTSLAAVYVYKFSKRLFFFKAEIASRISKDSIVGLIIRKWNRHSTN
jgi:hypothetical protein